jgi:hypothetical protein
VRSLSLTPVLRYEGGLRLCYATALLLFPWFSVRYDLFWFKAYSMGGGISDL